MELVAMELKQSGSFIARTLSYEVSAFPPCIPYTYACLLAGVLACWITCLLVCWLACVLACLIASVLSQLECC